MHWNYKEGDQIEPPAAIATVEGPSSCILHAERTALNVLSRASGIATRSEDNWPFVRAYILNQVKLYHGWDGHISGTRKTTPGFRLVEKYSLIIGGVSMHRNDLSHIIMLKDNHVYLSKEKGNSHVGNVRSFFG